MANAEGIFTNRHYISGIHLELVRDVDELLAAGGRVGQVDLHPGDWVSLSETEHML